jgi:hypothetical protein
MLARVAASSVSELQSNCGLATVVAGSEVEMLVEAASVEVVSTGTVVTVEVGVDPVAVVGTVGSTAVPTEHAPARSTVARGSAARLMT